RGLDGDGDQDVHVAVQVQLDVVIADHADRPFRQPYLAALDLDAERRHRLGNVHGPDRAEQLALRARLGLDADRQALELLRACLRGRELLRRPPLELGAALLELGDVLRRRDRRLALRDQIIARVARLDLHEVSDAAQVVDLLEQNDLHQVVSNHVRGRRGARKSNQLSINPAAASPSTMRPRSGVSSSSTYTGAIYPACQRRAWAHACSTDNPWKRKPTSASAVRF